MLVFLGFFACSSSETQSFAYKNRNQGSDKTGQNIEENTPQDTSNTNNERNEENRNDGISDIADDNSNEGTVDSPDNDLCGSRAIGANIGDCAENFSLPNQAGELVSLHDFVGDVIFIDLSSFT